MRRQPKTVVALVVLAMFFAGTATAQSTTPQSVPAKAAASAPPKKDAAAAQPSAPAACGDASLLEAAKESGSKTAASASKPSGKCEAGPDASEPAPSEGKKD